MRARGLAAGPVYRSDELIADPAFQASGMLVKLVHKEVGARAIPGLPVRFSGIEPDYRSAPMMGEHSEQVLVELLGYSSAEVSRLRAENIIF